LQAKEIELARDITDRLSGFLVQSGFYDGVRKLNAELLKFEIHPTPMSWIARTCLEQGEYDSARIWHQRSIDASTGSNRKEVAVAMHGIASIDLYKGDYEAARENFEKVMKIMQQIGDRAGEAAIFYQLGILVWEQGWSLEGLRLVALACIIDSSIGHADAKLDFEALTCMALELKYTQGQTESILKEVVEAYKEDRGQGLIDATFPKV
jgi:tetratricopeptide (TPR) repeat protein